MLRGGRTHTISLSLPLQKQAACLSIISCLFMESFTEKKNQQKKKKTGKSKWSWHRSNACNTHPDDPASLSWLRAAWHVTTVIWKQVSALETWNKLKQMDSFSNCDCSRAYMRECVCINHRTGTAECVGPCDFSMGIKNVTLAILCQRYLGNPACLFLTLA